LGRRRDGTLCEPGQSFLQAKSGTRGIPTLLNRCQTGDKEEVLEQRKKISPVAWQHIHFLGHYLFRDNRAIDLETILAHAGFD
jgi:hypothetical protein